MTAAEYSGDDDALFVLTATMLTPERFPGVLGDDYPAACAELGLEALHTGYGLLFGQDSSGARWTVATTDAAMVACALAAWDCGLPYDLSPDENTMVASLPGWPLPVAVSAPGVPAPHDPDEETGGGPPLAPPDTSSWGPRQRRLGADEIAVRWHEWRDQIGPFAPDPAGTGSHDNPDNPDNPGTASASATPPGPTPTPTPDPATAPGPPAPEPSVDDSGAGPVPEGTDGAAGDSSGEPPARPAPPPAISHQGVRRALAAAQEYVRNPPPPGRVRTAYGAVRADGPGWSLVGRTDDMAFVLLDTAPGEVLPVGRGPSLPPLLQALAALAAVPSAASATANGGA